MVGDVVLGSGVPLAMFAGVDPSACRERNLRARAVVDEPDHRARHDVAELNLRGGVRAVLLRDVDGRESVQGHRRSGRYVVLCLEDDEPGTAMRCERALGARVMALAVPPTFAGATRTMLSRSCPSAA